MEFEDGFVMTFVDTDQLPLLVDFYLSLSLDHVLLILTFAYKLQLSKRHVLRFCYSRVNRAEKHRAWKYPLRARKFISNHAQVVKNKWPGAITCPIKSRSKDRLFTRLNKQFVSPASARLLLVTAPPTERNHQTNLVSRNNCAPGAGEFNFTSDGTQTNRLGYVATRRQHQLLEILVERRIRRIETLSADLQTVRLKSVILRHCYLFSTTRSLVLVQRWPLHRSGDKFAPI